MLSPRPRRVSARLVISSSNVVRIGSRPAGFSEDPRRVRTRPWWGGIHPFAARWRQETLRPVGAWARSISRDDHATSGGQKTPRPAPRRLPVATLAHAVSRRMW